MQEEQLSGIDMQISHKMQIWYVNCTIFRKIMEFLHKLYFAEMQEFVVKERESNSQFQVVHVVWKVQLQP